MTRSTRHRAVVLTSLPLGFNNLGAVSPLKLNEARAKAIREIFARDGWQAYLRDVVKSSPRRISTSYLAELGEYDKAIEAIVKQSESRSAFWLFLNRPDPYLDPIRDDPRFKEAMKKLDPLQSAMKL